MRHPERGGVEVTPEMQAELDAWAGEWNTTVMRDLRTAERLKGTKLDRHEVMEVVQETMAVFGVPTEYVPYRAGQ